MAHDADTPEGLAAALVAIPSPSGDEAAVQAFIADWFRARGLTPLLEPAEDGLVNLIVEVEGAGEGPALLIGGHCDTVGAAPGWSTDPFVPTVRDGRLYGLGAVDMKGGLAAAMLATADLAALRGEWSGRLVFASFADEEAHSRGARAFLKTGRRIDAAVMAEPHFDDPVSGAIGKFNVRVNVTGRSAHGSRPAEGINAVVEAARLVAAIGSLERRPHPEFGRATHCVLRMAGGMGKYEIRVPDSAEVLINWHVMPGETARDARASVEKLAAELGSEAIFDVLVGEPVYESFEIAPDHRFLSVFADSFRAVTGDAPRWSFGSGVSDANLLNAAGIPTILFGPGGRNLHAADEWVDLAQLAAARDVMRDLGLHFAGAFSSEVDTGSREENATKQIVGAKERPGRIGFCSRSFSEAKTDAR